MIATNLLCQEIIPIHQSNTGNSAKNRMMEYGIDKLPVIRKADNLFIGMISELTLMDMNFIDAPISSLELDIENNRLRENEHLFDIVRKMSEQQTRVLPVIDDNDKYIGVIRHEDVIDSLVKLNAFKDPGGILVLEMNTIDYSLAAVAQIAESEGAKILASYVEVQEGTKKMSLTIKLNKRELAPIIATFERYSYVILASYQEKGNEEFLQDRYESFLHYLNV